MAGLEYRLSHCSGVCRFTPFVGSTDYRSSRRSLWLSCSDPRDVPSVSFNAARDAGSSKCRYSPGCHVWFRRLGPSALALSVPTRPTSAASAYRLSRRSVASVVNSCVVTSRSPRRSLDNQTASYRPLHITPFVRPSRVIREDSLRPRRCQVSRGRRAMCRTACHPLLTPYST